MDESSWVENIYGCTDSYAENYNSDANWDDGGCEYPDNGDYSLQFDGDDDYVDLGDILNELYQPVTFEISFLISNEGGGGELFATDNGFPSYYNGYFAQAYENIISLSYGDGGWVGGGERRSGNAIVDLDLNRWYHLTAIVRGPENFSFYLDGDALEMSYNDAGFGGEVNFTSDPFKIGSRHSSTNDPSYFDGQLDELRVWNFELSVEDIIQNYNVEPTGNEEGLVGYWKFNAGDGTTLYDHSGNQNHGTINGATWVENIYGCTHPNATNYDETANVDDGSCEFSGDYSLSFNGDGDYVDLGNQLDLVGDFTIEAQYIMNPPQSQSPNIQIMN